MLLWESMAENKDRQEGTNKTGKEGIRRFCSLLFSFLVPLVISQPEPSCLNLVDDEHTLAFGSCFQVTKNHLGYPKGNGTLNIRMLSWRIEVAIQNICLLSTCLSSSLFHNTHHLLLSPPFYIFSTSLQFQFAQGSGKSQSWSMTSLKKKKFLFCLDFRFLK